MKVATALLFVLMLNVFFFLAQTSITKINPEASEFFTYENSWISSKDKGNFTLNENLDGAIPSSQSSIGVDTGNVFTDTWRTISTWLKDTIPGYRFMEQVVNGPAFFLKGAGIAPEISMALGWIWHMFTVLLFIAFIRGTST
jgi:hypothetical protein